MEGGYSRGIPGVVPVGIPVYRVEVSVEKNRIGAHFGYDRMRPSGADPEGRLLKVILIEQKTDLSRRHVPGLYPNIYGRNDPNIDSWTFLEIPPF